MSKYIGCFYVNLFVIATIFLQKAMDERFATQAQIENDTRAYKLQCAKFDEEVNTAKVPFIYYVSTCIAQNLI